MVKEVIKKIYQNPKMKLMRLSSTQIICQSIKKTNGSGGTPGYGGGGNGEASAPEMGWDDWEE